MNKSWPILILLFFSLAQAQISINIFPSMEKNYSFKTRSMITRLMQTQQRKVESGIMDVFESSCIAHNIIDMLGDTNGERFTFITEKSQQNITLSLEDIAFMENIADRYMLYFSIITQQCTLENKKKKNMKIIENMDTPSS